jgi:hypothetical protein
VLDLSLGQSDAVEVIHQLEAGKYQGKVLQLISGRDETTLNEITQIGEKHGLKMLPPLKKPFRPADLKQRLSTGQDAYAALPAPPDYETRLARRYATTGWKSGTSPSSTSNRRRSAGRKRSFGRGIRSAA